MRTEIGLALVALAIGCVSADPSVSPSMPEASRPAPSEAVLRFDRFDGSSFARLPRCSLSEPTELTAEGPSPVETSPDRPLASIAARFGPEGAAIVWIAAGRDDGTWVVLLDRDTRVTHVLRLTTERLIGAFPALVEGGVIVGGYRWVGESTAHVSTAFGVTWSGDVGTETIVGDGRLLDLEGDHDAFAVLGVGRAGAAIHRLTLRGAEVEATRVVADLGLAPAALGLGFYDGAFAVRGERWAMLDAGGEVLSSEGRYAVANPAPADVSVERRIAYDEAGVLVVEDLFDGAVLTRALVGGRVEERGRALFSEATLYASPGFGGIVGPAAEVSDPAAQGTASDGTIIRAGDATWRLDDDGSWGNTWIGWNGRELVAIYTIADQSKLRWRRFICP